jgi:CO/xanthine dehydrogenase FAD-binding subunit
MDTPYSKIFYPSTFNELFSAWSSFPDAAPYAGGSDIIGRQGKNILVLPRVILCLDNLEDIHHITRSEQYLEIGAMVKLNRLARLGKIVPEILCGCIENIGGVQLRNIATIGGNICSGSCLYDLPVLLAALDAQYELRTANASRWVSAVRFHSTEKHTSLGSQELLTRIRLPLHQWDYSIYKKFYSEDVYNKEILVFLAKAQKNILSEIKVFYKANTILRNKDGEDILNGKHLPLSRKTALDFVESWKGFLSGRSDVGEFSKNAVLNNIEENILHLSE